jgi:hypothetical protein
MRALLETNLLTFDDAHVNTYELRNALLLQRRLARVRYENGVTLPATANRALARIVAAKLRTFWAPEQIAGWLKHTYSCDESLHVFHETIYRSLFIQARGALKKELLEHLRRTRGMCRSRPVAPPLMMQRSRLCALWPGGASSGWRARQLHDSGFMPAVPAPKGDVGNERRVSFARETW